MAYCQNCGSPLPENAVFCEKCGAPVGYRPDQPVYPNAYTQPYIDPHDHTADFEAADISENKIYAMAAYVLGTLGIILALLVKDSKYTAFHARQSLKITILTVLVAVVSMVLCWTVIVPIAGGVCCMILLVIRVICFFHVCAGKAKDAPLVSSFGFLN